MAENQELMANGVWQDVRSLAISYELFDLAIGHKLHSCEEDHADL